VWTAWTIFTEVSLEPMTMTVEQALNFRMPNGKALKDMSPGDWHLELERIRAEQAKTDALWRAGHWTEEAEQKAHAAADRLHDLTIAIQTVMGY
jgi:hypothetical protein